MKWIEKIEQQYFDWIETNMNAHVGPGDTLEFGCDNCQRHYPTYKDFLEHIEECISEQEG